MPFAQLIADIQKYLNVVTRIGYLGDNSGSGDPRDRARLGNLWVRLQQSDGRLSSPVSMAVYPNANINVVDGFPVRIGYDEDQREVILSAYLPGLQSTNPLFLNPIDTAAHGYTAPATITTFLCVRHGDTSSKPLYVYVYPAIVVRGTTTVLFAGEEIDLSGEVPATGEHLYTVVFWKTDNTLEIFSSTAKALGDPLTDADLQEAINLRTSGSLPIWAWELEGDQTALTNDKTKNVDLRQLINVVESSTGGGGAPDDAKYWVSEADGDLSAEVNLGALATGLLKHTVAGSVSTPATAVAGTDYTTPAGTENLSNKTFTDGVLIDGSADEVQLQVQGNGTQTALLAVFENSGGTDQVTISNTGAVVINEAGNDADFRVEGDTDTDLIHADASTDRVGIGTASPSEKLTVNGGIGLDTYIDFDETSTPSSPASDHGRAYAADDNGFTVQRWIDSGGIVFQDARDTWLVAKNVTGSTIAKGIAVYLDQSSGEIRCVPATNNSLSQLLAHGITKESIANNAYGRVLLTGILTDFDTSGLAVNVIYLGTSGALTTTAPTAGAAWRQRLGVVLTAHATTGSIYFNPQCPEPETIFRPDIYFGTGSNFSSQIQANTSGGTGTFTIIVTGNRGWAMPDATGTVALVPPYAVIEEQQATNTAGGASVATTWTTRVLNTEVVDADGIVSISSNLFTPIAGTYRIFVNAPFLGNGAGVSNLRIRLRNNTAGSTVLVSANHSLLPGQGVNATLSTQFTANGTDAYAIQYYVTVARATNGLGVVINEASNVERYTQVYLEKIG